MPHFKMLKRGYDVAGVDRYIEELEVEISAYKAKNEQIHKPLINAQMAADSIVLNAHNQHRIFKDTTKESIEEIYGYIDQNKAIMQSFIADYNAFMDKYLHPTFLLDFPGLNRQIEALEDYLNEFLEGGV